MKDTVAFRWFTLVVSVAMMAILCCSGEKVKVEESQRSAMLGDLEPSPTAEDRQLTALSERSEPSPLPAELPPSPTPEMPEASAMLEDLERPAVSKELRPVAVSEKPRPSPMPKEPSPPGRR